MFRRKACDQSRTRVEQLDRSYLAVETLTQTSLSQSVLEQWRTVARTSKVAAMARAVGNSCILRRVMFAWEQETSKASARMVCMGKAVFALARGIVEQKMAEDAVQRAIILSVRSRLLQNVVISLARNCARRLWKREALIRAWEFGRFGVLAAGVKTWALWLVNSRLKQYQEFCAEQSLAQEARSKRKLGASNFSQGGASAAPLKISAADVRRPRNGMCDPKEAMTRAYAADRPHSA